jgi:hypothetical protein
MSCTTPTNDPSSHNCFEYGTDKFTEILALLEIIAVNIASAGSKEARAWQQCVESIRSPKLARRPTSTATFQGDFNPDATYSAGFWP